MRKTRLLIFGIVLIIAMAWLIYHQSGKSKNLNHITGTTMGTIVYNVKYHGFGEVSKESIDDVLDSFNQSLSTYIEDSEISRLNRDNELEYESRFFFPVLEKSEEVYLGADKAFDPSIGPLVDAWGFGPNKTIPALDSSSVDSLKALIGFDKVEFDDEKVKIPANHRLDFSAIAKGYAVDLVAELLENEGIENYLVEIGGEVRCRGINEKSETWSLGIENPLIEQREQKIIAIVGVKDRSLATSGNYRNYYELDGKIYAHIIDPRTGYNSFHNLLSVSVFSSDCITADAYATAFMVLGMERSIEIVESNPLLDAILIYQDENQELRSYVSDGIKPSVKANMTNNQ